MIALLPGFLLKLPRCTLLTSRRALTQGSCEQKYLATFDFDLSIIEEDSYMAVTRLLPPDQRTKKLYGQIQESGWIAFMQQVLETLHQQHGIGAAKIAQQVREVPAVPGILGLLRRLAAQRAHIDMHIVSDANSFFIEHWLEAHQLTNIFAGVHTNPASVDCNELLQIMPYEQQTHCDLCPPNLCKGGVMANLMAAVHVPYKRIIYVGDSCNDLCAIVALRPGDIACIRCGEELHAKLPAHEHQLRCELLHWRDGDDLEQQLFDDCLRNL